MNFEALVAAEASGYAARNEIAVLEADPADWASTLRRLLIETDGMTLSSGLAHEVFRTRGTGPDMQARIARFAQRKKPL